MRCASESVGVLRSPKPSPTTTQQPSAWPSAYANPPSTLTQPTIHLQLQPRHDVNETTTTGLNLVAFCVVAAVLLRSATLRRDLLNPCGCSLGMWDHGNSTRRRFSPLLQNQTYTWHAYRSVRYRIVVYLRAHAWVFSFSFSLQQYGYARQTWCQRRSNQIYCLRRRLSSAVHGSSIGTGSCFGSTSPRACGQARPSTSAQQCLERFTRRRLSY